MNPRFCSEMLKESRLVIVESADNSATFKINFENKLRTYTFVSAKK